MGYAAGWDGGADRWGRARREPGEQAGASACWAAREGERVRAGPSAKAGRGVGRAGEWRSGPESGLTRESGPKWAFAGWAGPSGERERRVGRC